MALVEISIVPLGTKTTSISQYIARIVKVLQDNKDIKYKLTAMRTILEGDLEQLLATAHKIHQAVFNAGSKRIVTVIKTDDRRDKAATASNKKKTGIPKSWYACAHTGDGENSQHANTRQAGHGRCLVDGCASEKFTYFKWTDEAIKLHPDYKNLNEHPNGK